MKGVHLNMKRSFACGLTICLLLSLFCTGCKKDVPNGSSSDFSSAAASSETVLESSSQISGEISSQTGVTSSAPNVSTGVSSRQSSRTPTSSSSKQTGSAVPPTSSAEPRKTVRVTIPEGFTFLQVANRLEANGVCTAKEFYKTAQSYSPSSFTVPSSSDRAYKMEGYLYPDTYEFYTNDDPKDVLVKMLNNFRAKAGNITDKQLIVASIIEKESRSSQNAALVASVVYNRLNAGMKLEIDATREYVNKNVTGSPLLSSTGKYAALYNTYKFKALPAGPICNPGSRAIQAAKNPASSEYLFFFYGNDNQNHYSKTYEEHEAAMKKYGVQYG